eukprot:5612383-Pleurochrysis_carterae.AAC.1
MTGVSFLAISARVVMRKYFCRAASPICDNIADVCEYIEREQASATRIGRAEFEEELRSTSQISLRRVTRDEQKAMRCYMRIDGLLCDGARWRALLARADACAARLQPLREALEAADA